MPDRQKENFWSGGKSGTLCMHAIHNNQQADPRVGEQAPGLCPLRSGSPHCCGLVIHSRRPYHQNHLLPVKRWGEADQALLWLDVQLQQLDFSGPLLPICPWGSGFHLPHMVVGGLLASQGCCHTLPQIRQLQTRGTYCLTDSEARHPRSWRCQGGVPPETC